MLNDSQWLAAATPFLDKLQQALQQLAKMPLIDYRGCERTICYQEKQMKLYHYSPLCKKSHKTPTLLVYALVNRPSILDLQEDISFIRRLLLAGVDLYLIDWGNITAQDQDLALQDYLLNYLHHAVLAIGKDRHTTRINLLGICQGGTFTLCYSALYPRRIKNIITLVTPVDFHTADNRLTPLLKNIDMAKAVGYLGNISGRHLTQLFMLLRPYQNTLGKLLDLSDKVADRPELIRFLRVEQWLLDNPDQAGKAFQEFIEKFYQKNELITGKLRIGRRRVNLMKITQPMLNVFSQFDHIVPCSAAENLQQYISSTDHTAEKFAGGHIGIFISRKAQDVIPQKIAQWLVARDED